MSALKRVTFGNTVLADSGKRGILMPMEPNGEYYLLNGGGFNIPNRSGITYNINSYLEECMKSDSDFARRISEGQMQCELGHPPTYYYQMINGREVRTNITDIYEWIQRLRTVIERNVCASIRKVHFEYDANANIRTTPVRTKVEIRGFGPHKQIFLDSIKDPDMNTAVSIRTVTKPQQMGHTNREVDYWSTFDVVIEQGMLNACKYRTAGLEDFMTNSLIASKQDMELSCDVDTVVFLSERILNDESVLERLEGNESLKRANEMLTHLKKTYSHREKVVLRKTNSLGLFM